MKNIYYYTAILITFMVSTLSLTVFSNDNIYSGTIQQIRLLKNHNFTTAVSINYGGGIWYCDKQDKLSKDNTGTVLVDASSKRWKRIFDGFINVKWFGAIGNGQQDDSHAINAALNYIQSLNISAPEGIDASFSLRGGTLFFPAGKFKYSGKGWTHSENQSKNIRLIGEGRDATSIILENDIYFLSIGDLNSLQLEDMTFIGGLGTLRQTQESNQVRRLYIVSRCIFKDFKECAIGSNASDMPNWKISDCQFYGNRRIKNATIAISLSGLTDMDEVHGNEFLYCQYGIKLDRGGNSAKIYNNFFSTAQSNDGKMAANIWIVPNGSPINAGPGLEIRGNKFGIELQNPNAARLLIADEDISSGTHFFNRHPSEKRSNGYVLGINVDGNLFAGFTNQMHGLLYSYTVNISGIFWGPSNSIQGSAPKYIFEFPEITAQSNLTRAPDNVVHIPHSAQINEPSYAINLSNLKGFARYVDPLAVAQGHSDIIGAADRSAGTEYQSIVNLTGESLRPTLGSTKPVMTLDRNGTNQAAEYTFINNKSSFYSSFVSKAISPAENTWVEIDIKKGSKNSLDRINFQLTRKNSLIQNRVITLTDKWQTITLPLHVATAETLTVQLKPIAFVSGSKATFTFGKLRVYQSAAPIDFRGLQITGEDAGKWNGPHLIMGSYHIWVDAKGSLRMSNAPPKTDSDGKAF